VFQCLLVTAAPTAAELALDIADLQFAWPRRAPLLTIERLQLNRGERVFLSGASGSGKSTLLGLIGGVLEPQRGSVRVLGHDIRRLANRARDRLRGDHLGFVFQMFNLIPYLTVRANVLLPLQFSPARRERLGGGTPESEALRLLSALGLVGRDLSSRPVTQLSTGQQQRVAAARALIGRPELLICDEPTSSLDEDTRADFLRLLMNECAAYGATMLFVSHDRTLARLFDRAIALADVNVAATVAA
jgi:putative ABC transport system ATP-binding protein